MPWFRFLHHLIHHLHDKPNQNNNSDCNTLYHVPHPMNYRLFCLIFLFSSGSLVSSVSPLVLLGSAGAAEGVQGLPSSSLGNSKPIRPRICSDTKGNQGICMFSLACRQSNGKPIGICKDTIYAGSCCQLPGDEPKPFNGFGNSNHNKNKFSVDSIRPPSPIPANGSKLTSPLSTTVTTTTKTRPIIPLTTAPIVTTTSSSPKVTRPLHATTTTASPENWTFSSLPSTGAINTMTREPVTSGNETTLPVAKETSTTLTPAPVTSIAASTPSTATTTLPSTAATAFTNITANTTERPTSPGERTTLPSSNLSLSSSTSQPSLFITNETVLSFSSSPSSLATSPPMTSPPVTTEAPTVTTTTTPSLSTLIETITNTEAATTIISLSTSSSFSTETVTTEATPLTADPPHSSTLSSPSTLSSTPSTPSPSTFPSSSPSPTSSPSSSSSITTIPTPSSSTSLSAPTNNSIFPEAITSPLTLTPITTSTFSSSSSSHESSTPTTSSPSSTTTELPQTVGNLLNKIMNVQRPYNNQLDCGVSPLKSMARVVGGRNAHFGEWPWQVLIKEATWLGLWMKTKCGGVLIDHRWVLTAAHCQPGFWGSLLVVVGEYDLTGDAENLKPIQKPVKRMIVHRNYNPSTFENDIALMELESPFDVQPHVVPICLPEPGEEFVGQVAHVAGWGKLSYGGPIPSILQVVKLPILANEKCQEMFNAAGHDKEIKNTFLCAGYLDGGKDSCEGDSGGPLMVQRPNGHWVLVGTVSHGIKCAEPNLPGVYMKTATYRNWIDKIINGTASLKSNRNDLGNGNHNGNTVNPVTGANQSANSDNLHNNKLKT